MSDTMIEPKQNAAGNSRHAFRFRQCGRFAAPWLRHSPVSRLCLSSGVKRQPVGSVGVYPVSFLLSRAKTNEMKGTNMTSPKQIRCIAIATLAIGIVLAVGSVWFNRE